MTSLSSMVAPCVCRPTHASAGLRHDDRGRRSKQVGSARAPARPGSWPPRMQCGRSIAIGYVAPGTRMLGTGPSLLARPFRGEVDQSRREAPANPTATGIPHFLAQGRYRIAALIGEGAKKRVYLAHDGHIGRDVAVAFLKAERFDPSRLRRVREEARAMARLGDHPRIVAVYDVGEEQGTPYIIAEYMAGGTVERLLADAPDRRLSLEQAIRIADQVCQALAHAHARGVLHRDLKPANVWLNRDGFAKLGDFGLAISLDRSVPASGRLTGP